jgi:hypothetical protein
VAPVAKTLQSAAPEPPIRNLVTAPAPRLDLSVQTLASGELLIQVEAGADTLPIDILANGQRIRRLTSPPLIFSWRPEGSGQVTFAALAYPEQEPHLQNIFLKTQNWYDKRIFVKLVQV